MQHDKGYTNVDLNEGDARLVVGHPVTSSDPDLRLVTWWTEEGLEAYAQNPTDEDIRCMLRPNEAFAGLPSDDKSVTIAGGGVATVFWPAPGDE